MSAGVVPVLVRHAADADGERLAEIDQATWWSSVTPSPRPPVGTPFWRPDITPGDTLVADVDGEVVGFVTLGHPTPLPASTHVLMIRGLAVDPARHGRGIGQRLVEAALGEAERRGSLKVSLRVLGTNETARRLYERCGFEVEGVLRGEFNLDGALVDDYFLARSVDAEVVR